MDRHDERENETGFDSLADATGMERDDETSPMRSDRERTDEPAADEPTGDEKTAIEGAAGLGATNRGWGGTPTDVEGGAGTNVPAEADEEVAGEGQEPDDRTDPRGY